MKVALFDDLGWPFLGLRVPGRFRVRRIIEGCAFSSFGSSAVPFGIYQEMRRVLDRSGYMSKAYATGINAKADKRGRFVPVLTRFGFWLKNVEQNCAGEAGRH